LRNVVCSQLGLDHQTFSAYTAFPELVHRLEPLRRNLFNGTRDLSPSPKLLWPHVIRVTVIVCRTGSISHTRLLRWIGRKTPAWWLRKVVEILTTNRVIQIYTVSGSREDRPRVWYDFAALRF
jgi:hypothetical protein